MSNPLKLIPGQKYVVIKPFTDYDRSVHPIGEIFIFSRTSFLPYEDGLTLHVYLPGNERELVCRLQWRNEEQAEVIENFLQYVEPVKE